MSRRELREHIFKMLFRVEFYEQGEMAEQLEIFKDDFSETEEKELHYIVDKYLAIVDKLGDIDNTINEITTGWKTSRMAKVELTLIRLAVYEMKFDEDVPAKVAINEAVELAKIYGSDEAPAFVNGVLAKLV